MYSDRRKQGTHPIGSSDEIDIMDLLKKIWKGRFLIAGVMLLSAIIAFVVLKTLTSYYSIDVTIDVATEDQLRAVSPSYLRASDSQSFSSDQKKKSIEYQVSYPDTKRIYDNVVLQLKSIGVSKTFWEKKMGVVLDLRPGAVVSDDVRAFKQFYKSFQLEPYNIKTPDVTARKFSIMHHDSDEGVQLLSEYIDFLNEQVWLDYVAKLEAAYTANLNVLAVNYNALNLIEQRKLNDKIIGLRESLKVAESLGIKETPFKELENIQLKVLDDKNYLLGTKPLTQQIDILVARQGMSLAPFSIELRNMETWKDQMTSDLQRLKELNGKVRLFMVVNKPTSSLDPVKPNKSLIFIAVVFLSGLFGVFFVLIRSSFKNHKVTAN